MGRWAGVRERGWGGGGRVVVLSISLKLNVRWLVCVCVRTCVTFMCALAEIEMLFMQSLRRGLSVCVCL